MIEHLIILGLAFVFGLAATMLVRWLGHRFEVLDHPDGYRKVHKRPIPRIGGLAVYLAFFGALAVGAFLWRPTMLAGPVGTTEFGWVIVGATAVLFLGLWDDSRGMRASRKMIVLTSIAVLMYAVGFRIGAVTNPFGSYIELGLLALPVTLFWFLGCMNAINFIDGLDGLAAGVSLFVAGTILVSAFLFGNAEGAVLALALFGAAAGFLIFNFHPASIYLGDSGSYLLGFLIACTGMISTRKAHTIVALLVPVIAMGVPIADTALAILRRWARGVPLFASDRHHLHHKLLKMGIGHRQAVILIYAVCVGLAGTALLMTASRTQRSAAVLLLLALAAALVIRLLGRNEVLLAHQRVSNHMGQRKRRSNGNRIGYEAVERMRQAEHLPAVWAAFTNAADGLEMDHVRLTLKTAPEIPPIWADTDTLAWTRSGNGHAHEEITGTWSFGCSLIAGGARLGKVDIRKATNGQSLETHIPQTLQLLTSGLAQNIARLHPPPAPGAAGGHDEAGTGRRTRPDPKQLRLWAPTPGQPVLQTVSAATPSSEQLNESSAGGE